MIKNKTSLQNTLNELMKTGSTDAYLTRFWSTCSKMLELKGWKGKNEDNLSYIVDDPIPDMCLPSLLKHVQQSSKRMLRVTVEEQKEVKEYAGHLYAYFLIEGHTHTTHYVSLSREFPRYIKDKDFNQKIEDLSVRCKNNVYNTKAIIVMVAVDFHVKKEALVSEQLPLTEKILQKLIQILLQDGINTVVILTNPGDTINLPSPLSKEVN
jgi:hypothetical protein